MLGRNTVGLLRGNTGKSEVLITNVKQNQANSELI